MRPVPRRGHNADRRQSVEGCESCTSDAAHGARAIGNSMGTSDARRSAVRSASGRREVTRKERWTVMPESARERPPAANEVAGRAAIVISAATRIVFFL